jgi:hypothetical protein
MNPPKKEKKVEKMQEEFSSVDSKPAKNSSLMPFDEMKKFADNFFKPKTRIFPELIQRKKKILKSITNSESQINLIFPKESYHSTKYKLRI